MEQEMWKDIPGFEGLYQASTYGRIKSLPKQWVLRKGITLIEKSEHILNPHKTKKGYLEVSLCRDNKKTFRVNRLIALTFIPNPNNYPFVMHYPDDDTTNNNINNLIWGTPQMNVDDKMEKGRHRGNKKLTDKEVLEIRTKYIPRKYPQRKLAKEYGVSQRCILFVLKGETFKHLKAHRNHT